MTSEERLRVLDACHFNGCSIGKINFGDVHIDDIHIDQRKMTSEHNAKEDDRKEEDDHWQYAEEVDSDEVFGNDEENVNIAKDDRFERAIAAVGRSPYFKYQYDWTWTKVASEDDRVGLPVLKTEEYINKLSVLKVEKIPSRTDIDFHYSKVHQNGSVYSFADTQKDKEVDRRNKLINTFIGEYNKRKD